MRRSRLIAYGVVSVLMLAGAIDLEATSPNLDNALAIVGTALLVIASGWLIRDERRS